MCWLSRGSFLEEAKAFGERRDSGKGGPKLVYHRGAGGYTPRGELFDAKVNKTQRQGLELVSGDSAEV